MRYREFDETEVLEAAMRSFWAKGYDGTSVGDLECSMKLSRTSIYNAFGSKRELFEKTIKHYKQTVLADLVVLFNIGSDLQDSLKKLLEGVVNLHFRRDTPGGCFIALSVLEIEQHEGRSVDMLKEAVRQLQELLQNRIKADDRLPTGLDACGLSMMILAMMAGTMVMGKAGFSKTSLRKAGDTLCHLLDSTVGDSAE